MNIRKLRGCEQKLAKLRKGVPNSRQLEVLAKALGRRHAKRGKEPTWVSVVFPNLRPVAIPRHSSNPNKFTADSILNQLEEDIIRYKEMLEMGGQNDAEDG
jgi:hypothetical protein